MSKSLMNKIALLVIVLISFFDVIFAGEIVEWDGKDWNKLNQLIVSASSEPILVSYNKTIYEVGGKPSPDGGFNVYFKKSATTAGLISNSLEELNGVTVYPNPFNNSTTFSIQTNKDINKYPATLNIYDAMGRVVRLVNNITSSNFDIEKKELAQGIYFYKVFQNSISYEIGSGSISIN